MNKIISLKPTSIEVGECIDMVYSGCIMHDILSVTPGPSEGKVTIKFLDKEPCVVTNEDWEYCSYAELGDN